MDLQFLCLWFLRVQKSTFERLSANPRLRSFKESLPFINDLGLGTSEECSDACAPHSLPVQRSIMLCLV